MSQFGIIDFINEVPVCIQIKKLQNLLETLIASGTEYVKKKPITGIKYVKEKKWYK